jgi:hypothetical protein
MRRAIVLAVSSLFFYSLFRDMNLVKTLILAAAIASAYGISKIPSTYLPVAKYPMIVLSLGLCPLLIIYPWLRSYLVIAAGVMFLAFYGIVLFLVTLNEKGKEIYKEVTGLALLYGASAINLFLTGHAELVVPLSVSVLVFLFILNKAHLMPFMFGFAAVAVILLTAGGVHILGQGIHLQTVERYVLMAAAFLLFLLAFTGFVKHPDVATIMAFFGLLYISIDLLFSMGFQCRGVLLNQPVLALFIVGPAVGLTLKGGKKGA